MWDKGTIRTGMKNFTYCVKHFDEPSEEYGIDGGRISKLEIRLDDEAVLARYDRGWDITPDPEDLDLSRAFAFLLEKYN